MTGFPQLLCGWAMVNLESSGAGVGVVARSPGWPAQLGSTVREMGSLVTMPGDEPPDSAEMFALEFTVVGGIALAGLKTPSNARPGTCVTHLVAGEPGVLDGVSALHLFDSGGFVSTLNGSVSPTDQWDTAALPAWSTENLCAAAALDALDEPWLPVLIGAALARLAGQGPSITLQVDSARQAVRMLRALYGMLPRKPLREFTFSTYAEQSSTQPAIVATVPGNTMTVSGERRVITRDSSAESRTDTFSSMGRELVRHRRDGVMPPESLASVHDIYQWCYQRHLRTIEPSRLDDDELAAVITDPELTADWFAHPAVARRAIALALDQQPVAKALGRLEFHRELRSLFEKVLVEHVRHGGRERTRAAQLAGQLGFDISREIQESAWKRLGDGALASEDAQTVWPRLLQSWTSGSKSTRAQVLTHLQQHRTLREYALVSKDRDLAYEAILAEVNDPAAHPGSSQLLLNAIYTHVDIVGRLLADVSATGGDRYILEQVLGCAPDDRLPALISACAYYGCDPIELLRAVTLVRADPADIVAALQPGWESLRALLPLPDAIAPLVVLDATAEERFVEREGRRGLPSPLGLIRRRPQTEWHESEIIHMFSTADHDFMIEDCYEILRAAIDSDVELVADCMAGRSRTPSGAKVLARVMASAGIDRLPTLIAAAARHPELDPHILLRAASALRLDPAEQVAALERGWRSLRLRLDLPHRIATLLVLEATGTAPLPPRESDDPREPLRRKLFRR
ncbi:hypothetical protein H0264_13635 [Nocardia huaxiensis]|uniref:GTPase-associated protein 1 middle domain-containing protein n=1 Tax=Nocardia huaxiensis TaxID=2755382 RepID=A0A7D7A0Q0_9NOCA|nr:hypothetical protein [Nocardia huaxiensis]QLY33129.1 hypothetical protein H0264_13635 [Nocardia huaxiensis]